MAEAPGPSQWLKQNSRRRRFEGDVSSATKRRRWGERRASRKNGGQRRANADTQYCASHTCITGGAGLLGHTNIWYRRYQHYGSPLPPLNTAAHSAIAPSDTSPTLDYGVPTRPASCTTSTAPYMYRTRGSFGAKHRGEGSRSCRGRSAAFGPNRGRSSRHLGRARGRARKLSARGRADYAIPLATSSLRLPFFPPHAARSRSPLFPLLGPLLSPASLAVASPGPLWVVWR